MWWQWGIGGRQMNEDQKFNWPHDDYGPVSLLVNREFIRNLPSNWCDAVEVIASNIQLLTSEIREKPSDYDQRDIMSFSSNLVLLKKFLAKSDIAKFLIDDYSMLFEFENFVLDYDLMSNTDALVSKIMHLLLEIEIDEQFFKQDFSNNGEFEIVLEEEERVEIQNKIDDLRKAIQENTLLTPSHKRRLLSRLERMQLELHKVMSDYDVFLGGVVDAANAAGQVGEDVKPLIDRFREIAEVFWRKSSQDQVGKDQDLPQLPGS